MAIVCHPGSHFQIRKWKKRPREDEMSMNPWEGDPCSVAGENSLWTVRDLQNDPPRGLADCSDQPPAIMSSYCNCSRSHLALYRVRVRHHFR